MDLLARREHSRLELERKLKARAFAGPELDGVLDELEHEGLLSDTRFAQSFAAARYARGQGPYRIRRDLKERGVEVADELDGFDWSASARQARVKRFGHDAPADLKDRARQIRFLEYRGFGQDEIRHALEFEDE